MKTVTRLVLVGLVACAFSPDGVDAQDLNLEFNLVNTVYDPGAEFPYTYEYELVVLEWDPLVPYVNDLHLKWPLISPGGIRVTPPAGWHGEEYFDGAYLEFGAYADGEADWVSQPGTLGDWTVEGHSSELIPGEAWLTQDTNPVGPIVPAMLPIVEGQDLVLEFNLVNTVHDPGAEFPYTYEYELVVVQWDPLVPHINDLHVRWPLISPGGIRVTPPAGWHGEEYYDGEYFEFGAYADGEADWVTQAGTLGGWTIEGNSSELIPGEAWLTKDTAPVGPMMQPMLPSTPNIPTVSQWGLVVLGLLLITGGTILVIRRRPAKA